MTEKYLGVQWGSGVGKWDLVTKTTHEALEARVAALEALPWWPLKIEVNPGANPAPIQHPAWAEVKKLKERIKQLEEQEERHMEVRRSRGRVVEAVREWNYVRAHGTINDARMAADALSKALEVYDANF